MPELPEVETVRKKLHELVVGKTIDHVEVFVERIIRTPDVSSFIHRLKNQTIHQMGRKGKHLIFYFENQILVSHLRMEGKYFYRKSSDSFNKHDHVIFHFTDGTKLCYNDVRKFGTMDLVTDINDVNSVKELGLEPMDASLTTQYLKDALSSKKKNIKNVLLEQSIVSGLGNIYVDEVLFYAGIHPERMANQLTSSETQSLVKGIKEIISIAIESGGSTIRSYNSLGDKGSMQNFHKVYGRDKQQCVRCDSIVEKIKVGGRGTHFCPKCQIKK
jgi:formamidopyrimidine-DNA glycosylase